MLTGKAVMPANYHNESHFIQHFDGVWHRNFNVASSANVHRDEYRTAFPFFSPYTKWANCDNEILKKSLKCQLVLFVKFKWHDRIKWVHSRYTWYNHTTVLLNLRSLISDIIFSLLSNSIISHVQNRRICGWFWNNSSSPPRISSLYFVILWFVTLW